MQCELCGADADDTTTVKIEGATLNVCDNCAGHGTEIETESGVEAKTTKYSTDGSPETGGSTDANRSSENGSTAPAPDGAAEVAPDYDDRIREAREAAGLDRGELADSLNEKASRIRRLERGETLPDADLQVKLESKLGITLAAEDAPDDWEGGDGNGSVTLGDVVRRD